jgi:hypothetical protein
MQKLGGWGASFFQRTFPEVSHYTFCTHLENPGEKEPCHEFIKESPGVCRVARHKLDLHGRNGANIGRKANREKFQRQTLHIAGE